MRPPQMEAGRRSPRWTPCPRRRGPRRTCCGKTVPRQPRARLPRSHASSSWPLLHVSTCPGRAHCSGTARAIQPSWRHQGGLHRPHATPTRWTAHVRTPQTLALAAASKLLSAGEPAAAHPGGHAVPAAACGAPPASGSAAIADPPACCAPILHEAAATPWSVVLSCTWASSISTVTQK